MLFKNTFCVCVRIGPGKQVAGGVNTFNKNRKGKILTGCAKVMDEPMLAFKSRTAASLSFIQLKPKPFGTKFKSTLCAAFGMPLFLELRKGRDPMTNAQCCDELQLTTAATTMRLVEPVLQKKEKVSDAARNHKENDYDLPEFFLGDSWFASMEAATHVQ